VCREHVFKDSSLFYRFVEDEIGVLDADGGDVAELTQSRDDVVDVVSYLCQMAPDATMRMILRKPYETTHALSTTYSAEATGRGGWGFQGHAGDSCKTDEKCTNTLSRQLRY